MELMVVMLIIAILSAIALPSYMEQVRTSRRVEAHSALLQAATLLDVYRTESNTFTSDLTELGFPDTSIQSENGYYQIIVLPSSADCLIATCYALQASPAAGSSQERDQVIFQIWSDGRRLQRGKNGIWSLGWKK